MILKYLKAILKSIYSLYAFVLFVFVILALFPCLLVCLPFGKIRGGNIMYDLFRIMGGLWLKLIGINHTVSFESIPEEDKQYIFIANHISYIDAVIIICSISHHFRPIGKYELLKVPIFGWLYKFCVVTVNRSSAEDRARSLVDLRKILDRGISILVFPEGTFNMADEPLKEMFDGAFKLALETGKTIQPIIFLDAYDRMPYESLFLMTPGKSRAVYLSPIDPSEFSGIDVKELKSIAEKKMSDKLIEYKASWINKKYLDL
jgi:1-acyl-sn-glycerol-3-phosphate acyltransferase